MGIRRRRRRITVIVNQVRRTPGLGAKATRGAAGRGECLGEVAARPPVVAPPSARYEETSLRGTALRPLRTSVARLPALPGPPVPEHSIEKKEIQRTTKLLDEAISGTLAAFDANR
jgi:hypothetical protein